MSCFRLHLRLPSAGSIAVPVRSFQQLTQSSLCWDSHAHRTDQAVRGDQARAAVLPDWLLLGHSGPESVPIYISQCSVLSVLGLYSERTDIECP
jgi:hypothetical protein